MPQQTAPLIESNFSQGFKTEFTGLNFPENAVTDTQNCIFNRIGNVTRRSGIDYETNFLGTTIDRTNKAINYYKWKNVGGDGNTQVLVIQVGDTLRFYRSSTATIANPLSRQIISSPGILISSFTATGGTFDPTIECQFTDGNGYLFVFHPNCDPFYCSYLPSTVTANSIAVQQRDFLGTYTGYPPDFRSPQSGPLAGLVIYNLYNQGWTNTPSWSLTSSTSNNGTTGVKSWGSVQSGQPVALGQSVTITGSALHATNVVMGGTVVGYGGSNIAVNVTSSTDPSATFQWNSWVITSSSTSKIDVFISVAGSLPSDADVWWRFKNTTGLYDPATTLNNVTLSTGPAPQGSIILEAFNQQRSAASQVANLNPITTTLRPRTGAWYAGRVWYTGVDASVNGGNITPFYTWTENIYFSQIIQKPDQFGKCYQQNDPTSEALFDLLPSDGGVITIQGTGAIYKLFPIQNGLLVFAANGVWFITGSQGIGFAANDYTITKISNIQSISSNSFVDVQGYPIWWNEEGIYKISTSQGGTDLGASRGAVSYGSLNVEPITFTTIQTFYQNIPQISKKYVKGDYNSLDWVITWTYKGTNETDITSRYQFDKILVYNTVTQAFTTWSLDPSLSSPFVHGVAYIQSPGGSNAPEPTLKYITSIVSGGSYSFTFAEESDITRWVDWHSSGTDYNYISYFTTGYKLLGKSLSRFQSNYINVYINNYVNMSYKLQGIWDFAINRNSNRYTALERTVVTDSTTNFAVVRRRHRIRGRGMAQQFKVTSVDGSPFDIIGWSVEEKVNQGL